MFAISCGLKLVESINKCSYLAVDICDQFLDLALGVQKLYCLCVRVIAHTKWPRNGGSKITKTKMVILKVKSSFYLHHLLLGTLKALSDKVYWLVLCDWMFL